MGLFERIKRWLKISKSPYRLKIEAISIKYKLDDVANVYYVGGFELRDDNTYKEFQTSIAANSLVQFLETHPFNAPKDVIELYLVELKSLRSELVVINSPIELYANDSILEIFNADEIDLAGVSKEKVF